MPQKQPNPIDVHVGARVRLRRVQLAMSQEKLAGGLGLTFQQVQKYEKGTNRIGASRLMQIATVLQVPPAFFFEGAPGAGGEGGGELDPAIMRVVSTTQGLALVRAFDGVKRHRVRHDIVVLVEGLAAEPAVLQAAE